MSDRDAPIVSVQGLHFAREGEDGPRVIYQDLYLDVPEHAIVGIMGPSGTGKTTLLQLITGQILPSSGSIFVAGKEITHLSKRALFKMRRDMGVLFQSGALFTDLNVFENVAFPLREHTQLPEEMIRDLVLMMLEAVGLRGVVDLNVDQLSGGMKRRVALARSVILGPKIMMYDEPFSGQDPISRGVLLSLIQKMNKALNLTSIIISHDVLETAKIADYIYILYSGRIIGKGEPEALLRHNSPLVRQFLEGNPDGPICFHYPAKDFYEELL